MAVKHFVIKHGGHRIKFGGHSISTTAGSVSITVNNQSTNASFSQSVYFAPVNSTLTIPLTYVDGADETCISSTSGTVTSSGIQLTVGVADTTITVSDTKVKVAVSNQFSEGVSALNPLSQYVNQNTTATVAVTFNSGYTSADVNVSAGSITGTTWSIPVELVPISATLTKATSMSVHIGANDYKVVKIGNLLWTAANLAEPIPGRAGQTKYRWAHNETDNTNGYGMLYAINSIHNDANGDRTALESLFPSGWRIPSNTDMTNLKNNCSSYLDLMRVDEGGNDKFRFAGLNTGQAYDDGISPCFEFTTFQLHTLGSYDTLVVSHSSPNYWLQFHNNGSGRMIAIRLCKDA